LYQSADQVRKTVDDASHFHNPMRQRAIRRDSIPHSPASRGKFQFLIEGTPFLQSRRFAMATAVKKRPAKASTARYIGKPTGLIQDRVQKVGPNDLVHHGLVWVGKNVGGFFEG
jgi:hypothetical protein